MVDHRRQVRGRCLLLLCRVPFQDTWEGERERKMGRGRSRVALSQVQMGNVTATSIF